MLIAAAQKQSMFKQLKEQQQKKQTTTTKREQQRNQIVGDLRQILYRMKPQELWKAALWQADKQSDKPNKYKLIDDEIRLWFDFTYSYMMNEDHMRS